MRIIVVGADGKIGGALFERLKGEGHQLTGTSRRSTGQDGSIFFDLASPEGAQLPPTDVMVICAAMTRFAECRQNPELAHQVNCVAPVRLARLAVESGSRVLFLSTSAVMDCQNPQMAPDRRPAPRTVYGQTKADAERDILALGSSASIVRLTKVVDSQDHLICEWIERLKRGQTIEAFDNHRISPVTMETCIDALSSIIGLGDDGIYQVSGASDVSYYEIALHIARRLDIDSGMVLRRGAELVLPSNEILPFTSLSTDRLSLASDFHAPEPFQVLDEAFFSAQAG